MQLIDELFINDFLFTSSQLPHTIFSFTFTGEASSWHVLSISKPLSAQT